MARRARCWRVRSVLTRLVNHSEAAKINIHSALVKGASGQLPFLGSSQLRHINGRNTPCPLDLRHFMWRNMAINRP